MCPLASALDAYRILDVFRCKWISLHLDMSFFSKNFQDVLLVFLPLDSQVCIDLDFDIARGRDCSGTCL